MLQKNNSINAFIAFCFTVAITNVFAANLFAQKKEVTIVEDSIMLKGYFLLYRKSIHNEVDHSEPRTSYKIFFVERISESVLSDFIDMDSLRNEIQDVGCSAGDINILDEEARLNALNNTNWRNNDPFNFTKNVADYLINNDDRFIAIYQGSLLSKGPYKVVGNVIRRNTIGYLYVKSRLNTVKYLYAIVLPKLTEEKVLSLPHAYLQFDKISDCNASIYVNSNNSNILCFKDNYNQRCNE